MIRTRRTQVIAVLLIFLGFLILYLVECTLYPVTADTIETTAATIDPSIEIETTYSRSKPETLVITEPPMQYGFNEGEIYLLAQLLCGDESIDGDGEFDFVWQYIHDRPYKEEMSKVLCVVMNRVRSDIYPDTVKGVVMQSEQFTPMPENSYTSPSDIAIQEVRKWCEAYDYYDPKCQIVPEDHLYFRAGPNLTNVTRRTW